MILQLLRENVPDYANQFSILDVVKFSNLYVEKIGVDNDQWITYLPVPFLSVSEFCVDGFTEMRGF